MIFLQDNVYLKRKLTHEDVKPRLLGKWPLNGPRRNGDADMSRSLGYMSRTDPGIFSSELLDQEK